MTVPPLPPLRSLPSVTCLLFADVNGDSLLQFGGRLHPSLLHLPIGMLMALAALEAFSLLRRSRLEQSTRSTLAWLSAMLALATMISGLLLSREDSYSSDALQTHKLLGIGVAVGAVLTAVCASMPSRRSAYAALLVATITLTIPAGHIGGTMTHGEDFLTAPFATERAPGTRPTDPADQQPAAASTPSFAASVAPIISERCLGCHSAARHRGGLAMHTAEALLAGGEDGPVVVPGNAAGSEIISRLRRPLDEEGHMPPKSKAQPTEQEIAAIEAWINAGAPVGGLPSAGAGDAPDERSNAEPAGAALDSHAPTPPSVSPPVGALDVLRAAQAHVEPVEPDRGLLWIDFAAVPTLDDATAQSLLTPLLDWVSDLSLAGTKVGDGAAALASRMPHLRSLDLSRTACSPAGVQALRGHAAIEELRLTQTKLDDSAMDAIASLPALRRVYLWNAGVSPEAAGRLHAANSQVLIDVGVVSQTEPLETEGAIALSSEAPAPGAAGATAAALAPVNSTCPVSGAAIDSRFAIVHDGKVIGFCCQECPSKFWAEPARYPIVVPQ